MATHALDGRNSRGSALVPIRKQVIDAIKVMFRRAIQHGADSPEINDKKTLLNFLPSGGPVQDCEFGMILLLAREWFRNEAFESEFFENINIVHFEKAIGSLVKRTVERVLVRMEVDERGGGKHAAFFTGEPYSQYREKGLIKYSANLDAAMTTIGFLALAVEQFDNQLAKVEHEFGQLDLPYWVKNIRDSALFVIREGLIYAQECRIVTNNKFQGFTCDPESNTESPEDGNLASDEDRLFFTWIACETITDLIAWRDSYLCGHLSILPPKQALDEVKSLISDLEVTLHQATDWCYERFFLEWEKFEPEDPSELVRQIGQLAGKKMSPKQKERLEQMEKKIQHVYHMSQYAGVRSLAPERLLLQEVHTIIDKLDGLVSISIIGSGLDESERPDLLATLTRKYSLGKSSKESHIEDAWYPLVVRSLSGLLSRILSEAGKRFSRSDVLSLTLTCQRSLETHVRNLLDRRPQGGKDGPDGKLWSFAADQPYVLYATQRTILALMRYADFLKAVDEFSTGWTNPDTQREELSMAAARKLVDDHFRPMIRESLSQIQTSATASTATVGKSGSELPASEESLWTEHFVPNWLKLFAEYSVPPTDSSPKNLPDIVIQEEELLTLMARKLADDYFRPLIKEILSQIPESPPCTLTDGQSGMGLPLPEESWATRVVRDWLVSFTGDFKKSQVPAMLRQRAQSLKLIKKYAEGYQPSESLPRRKRDNARDQLQELRVQYERICQSGDLGQKLSHLAAWEDEDLISILFEHVFQEYVQRSIGDFLRSDSIALWKLIDDAKDRLDNISKIGGEATV